MIGAPCGGGETVKVTEACLSPGMAVTFVGAAGTAIPGGFTDVLATEAGLVPTALLAVTVNVYEVPLANPLISTDVAGKLDPATGTTVTGATGVPAVIVVTL